MPFSCALPASDFPNVAEAGPSSFQSALLLPPRHGRACRANCSASCSFLSRRRRRSTLKSISESELALHAGYGGAQPRGHKAAVRAYPADMELSDAQIYLPVQEDPYENSLLLGESDTYQVSPSPSPHSEELDPFSQVIYQHAMAGNLHCLRFLAYCRSQLNSRQRLFLAGKNYTKVLLPTRFPSGALSIPAISAPPRRDPVSTALNQINLAVSELFSWFAQMGDRYGGSLLCLLALGYWVQGFRCFPWLAMCFYLKDGLRVDPATLQFWLAAANLPMVAKPAYGIISDVIYINGNRRMPYLMFAGALQVMSWSMVVLHSGIRSSISPLMGVLLVSNVGAAMAEVVNDALVAESTQKEIGRTKGELQSFVWLAFAAGGVLGNLSGGLSLSRVSPTSMFAVFVTLAAGHLAVSSMVKESSFNFKPQRPIASSDPSYGVSTLKVLQLQAGKLVDLVIMPEISLPLAWFAASYAVIPAMGGSLFFFQTQHLKIHPTFLGLAKVIGQVGLLAASLLYNRFWKRSSPRKVLSVVQMVLFACMLTDIVLVCRLNIKLGIPDHLFVLGVSAFVEAIGQFKILPFTVLLTQLCPAGSEGSLLAFFMSCHCLALIMSACVGTMVASILNLSATNFSGLPLGIVIQSFAALIPLFWISCIPSTKHDKMATT